jgi:hypothetical protein
MTKLIRDEISKYQLTFRSESAGTLSLFMYTSNINFMFIFVSDVSWFPCKTSLQYPYYISVYSDGSRSHFVKVSALYLATKLVATIASFT